VRTQVPLLLGLVGPSGSGKTYSALELATGIQEVTGGDIAYIDTEADRALHYADIFKFLHVPFSEPFGSLDYLEALRFCKSKGAGVIVIDSASHEHEGVGGMLDFHEHEVTRLCRGDDSKAERVKMLAWGQPKAARRALINGLLQMKANFIFCFRAKNVVKPIKTNGKTEIVQQGFIPISGDELVYEMTADFLLMPHSDGVPTWQSEYPGERMAMKLPVQFRQMFAEKVQLSRAIGRQLAEWAGGGKAGTPGLPAAAPERSVTLLSVGETAARQGTGPLEFWWKHLTKADQKAMLQHKDRLKAIAAAVPKSDALDPTAGPNEPASRTRLDVIERTRVEKGIAPEALKSLCEHLGIKDLEKATVSQVESVIINLQDTSGE